MVLVTVTMSIKEVMMKAIAEAKTMAEVQVV
jgi:hypothetical protein